MHAVPLAGAACLGVLPDESLVEKSESSGPWMKKLEEQAKKYGPAK